MSPPPEDHNNRAPVESGSCPNLSLESLDHLWPLILQKTSTGNNRGPSASVFLDQQGQYLAQTNQYPSFPECDILSYPPEITGGALQEIAIPGECSPPSPSAAAAVERNNDTNDELMLELAKSRDLGEAGSGKSVMSCEMTETAKGMIRENKTEDHNAKERIRRKNLNACYWTLPDLLPCSPSSKKRRGAPAIIDGGLEYIPEIKKEIEELTLQKENMLSAIDQNKQLVTNNASHTTPESADGHPTISVHEITKGELVLQICMKRDRRNLVFSNLLWNLEAEGVSVLDASTVEVPHDRVCFHLNIQKTICFHQAMRKQERADNR